MPSKATLIVWSFAFIAAGARGAEVVSALDNFRLAVRDSQIIDRTALLEGEVARSGNRSLQPSVGEPKPFAPESEWPAGSDASPAFTPDGRTVLFTHSNGSARTIMVSHLREGVWSTPEVASFSGTWRDIEPAMAPDGSYLVFISNRPAAAGGEPLTGFFGGAPRPGAGGNIWRVNREGDGWGTPVRLPTILNSNSAIYSPAIARDGSIYFNQPDPITKRSHIYRAQATIHGFDTPVAVSISDGTIAGYDAAVAPDESFIVFSSNRSPASSGQSLLFIAFAQNGHWTVPETLQPITEGLEARLSPDLKSLYFSADALTPNLPNSTDNPMPSRIFQIPILFDTGDTVGSRLNGRSHLPH